MRNENAQHAVDDCKDELARIGHLIQAVGATNEICNYLSKYALIRISGTLEICYKTIIADYYESISPQLERFISRQVREATRNPLFENMCKTLTDFDKDKCNVFKEKVKAISDAEACKSSLDAINTNRNNVAHGSGMTLTFIDIKAHFTNALRIIEVLDEVI